MIKLAIPGLIMIVAEYLAFEILTLAASHISGTHLAAQSILSTIACLMYQIPFPMSIAASTRIANFIGAGLTPAAKSATKVAIGGASFVGIFNFVLLFSLRHVVPKLFTSDDDVAQLVAATLPVTMMMQLADAIGTTCNGILRGLGRQDFGGYVNLIAYYGIALPIAFATGFGLKWGLFGLWIGPAIGLLL
jgi:MATE family, multidrug and toxin extrusion protein